MARAKGKTARSNTTGKSKRKAIDAIWNHALIAIGLSGEPTPPVTGSGGAQKKNSHTPSSAQSSDSSPITKISPMVMPIMGITTQCHGCWASSVSLGRTSQPQVSQQIAAISLS